MSRAKTHCSLPRSAMQLLELVISLSIASVLMAGVTSAVVISQRTLDSVALRASGGASAQAGLQQLQNDLAEAQSIETRSANSMKLILPDRDNDGVTESVHYRWSLTSGPLESSADGTTWQALTPSLSNLQLNWRTSPPQSTATITPLDVAGRVSYRGITSNILSSAARSMTLALPPSYVAGEVCVAVIAFADNPGGAKADASWTKLEQSTQSGDLTLAYWYSTNPTSNPVFSWPQNEKAIGCILHLTGTNATQAYVGSNFSTGNGQIAAPAISGTHTNEFVVRVLAGFNSGVTNDSPSVANHAAILFRQTDIPSSSNYLTLAVATQSLPTSAIGAATFQYTPANSISCSGTIAFKP